MKAPRFFQHFGLKVLSLGIAVVLWLVVAGEEPVERGLRIPLELQQFPPGLELQTEAPSLVDVRVRGASGTLSRVGAGDVIAVLDLHAARKGRRLFQLSPEQVRTPFGVQVVQVNPATLALVFENSVTRQVPVVAAVEGSPAPGYTVGRTTVDPRTVEVVGPESALERVSEAFTEPVSVSGARQDVLESVTVGFESSAVRLKNPRLANVRVQVVPGPVERTLRDRPVRLRNLALGLIARAVPPVVDVTLRGTRQGVNRIDAGEMSAYVDLTGLGVGEYMLAAHADTSPDVGISRIEPSSVQVRVTSAKE